MFLCVIIFKQILHEAAVHSGKVMLRERRGIDVGFKENSLRQAVCIPIFKFFILDVVDLRVLDRGLDLDWLKVSWFNGFTVMGGHGFISRGGATIAPGLGWS